MVAIIWNWVFGTGYLELGIWNWVFGTGDLEPAIGLDGSIFAGMG